MTRFSLPEPLRRLLNILHATAKPLLTALNKTRLSLEHNLARFLTLIASLIIFFFGIGASAILIRLRRVQASKKSWKPFYRSGKKAKLY